MKHSVLFITVLLVCSGCWRFFGSDNVQVFTEKGLSNTDVKIDWEGYNKGPFHVYDSCRSNVQLIEPDQMNLWHVYYQDSLYCSFSTDKDDGREDHKYDFYFYKQEGKVCCSLKVDKGFFQKSALIRR